MNGLKRFWKVGVALLRFRAFLLVVLAMAPLSAQAQQFPDPRGYVNDFASMISPEGRDVLEEKLIQHEKATTNEVVVVTVKSLEGSTIEDYAVRLFEKWKIGKKEKDNGVLLLVAEEERELRIEVGYGLEPELTDGESYGVISRKMVPAFKEGQYEKGINDGVNEILKGLAGEDLPEESQERDEGGGVSFSKDAISVLFFLFFAIPSWIASILARTRSWWLGGLLGLVAGIIVGVVVIFTSGFFQGLITGIVATLVLAILGALLDLAVSNNYLRRKDRGLKPSWWAGGGWGPSGPSSWRGGGFGGFGGGRSGGGGASGGW